MILVVAGSVLLLRMCTKAKWSTITPKIYLFQQWAKLAILIANPHISNPVLEYFFATSGNLLLAYAISLGLPFCIWHRALPIGMLTGIWIQMESSLPSGNCNTGGFCNLHLISSNVVCCSCPQMKYLSFLVKS